MKIHNIMTQPPQTCTIHMDLAAASRRMRDTGCGTLAVLEHRGRLAGIVTDRDLALAIADARDPAGTAVEDVMTRRVHICRPDDDLHVALEQMAKFKIRRLPVVTHDGDIKGVVSIDDIILWGVQHSGVSLHELVAALRSICVADVAALQDTAEP